MLAVVLVIIAGAIATPLAFVVYPLVLFVFFVSKKTTNVFFVFLTTFILGDSRQGFLAYWYHLRFIGVLFLLIFVILILIKKELSFNRLFFWLSGFLIFAILAAANGPIPGIALMKIISYLSINFVAIHFIPYLIQKNPTFLRDLAAFLLIILGLGFCLIPIAHDVVWFRGGNRYNGIWGNPNGLGMSSLLYFIINYLILKIDKKILPSWFLILFNGLLFVGLFWSASRGGLLSIILFWSMFSFLKLKMWLKVAAVSVFLPALIFLSNPVNLLRVASSLGLAEKFRLENAEDGGGRFIAWKVAVDNLKDTYLVGKGMDYDIYLFKSYKEYFKASGHDGNVHNSFITFILNIGIPGLIFVLVYYGNLLYQIRLKSFIYPIMISCTFSAFFESWLSGSLNPFLIFFLTILTIGSHAAPNDSDSVH